ncbi:MAG: hypothetical protein J7K75_05195 [Desulfuromonas sp.]|nr:hypothetical protein [Desulfuromonas sp.]
MEIVDGQQEALLMATGVLAALYPPLQRCVIFDIGGGSTELVCVENGVLRFQRSWAVGVVRLLDEPDPVSGVSAMLSELKQQLQHCQLWPQVCSDDWTLVGMAGTVTILAAAQLEMTHYQPQRINNVHLNRQQLDRLDRKLSKLSIAEREALPGIETGRGATIVPGVQLVLRLLEFFDHDELVVCDAGLLQGVFHSTWGEQRSTNRVLHNGATEKVDTD